MAPQRLTPGTKRERTETVKSRPDPMLILMALFGLGVVITLMLPVAANDSVAAPASALQAGVIVE